MLFDCENTVTDQFSSCIQLAPSVTFSLWLDPAGCQAVRRYNSAGYEAMLTDCNESSFDHSMVMFTSAN